MEIWNNNKWPSVEQAEVIDDTLTSIAGIQLNATALSAKTCSIQCINTADGSKTIELNSPMCYIL
jgi:hypothetical protein